MVYGTNYKMLVGCVYRASCSRPETDTALCSLFARASTLDADYKVIARDFNLPHINWKTSSGPQRHDDIITAIDLYGWTQYVTQPTRGNNILDLIFCHSIIPITTQVGEEWSTSDHRVVFCSLPIPSLKTTHKQYRCDTDTRCFRNTDWELLVRLIKYSEWNDFFTTDSLRDSLTIFYTTILSCLDTIAPKTICLPSRNKSSFLPRKHRAKLRKLLNLYFSSYDFSCLHLIWETLESSRISLDRGKRNEELVALKSGTKTNSLTALLNKRTRTPTDIPFLIQDGKVYNDPGAICEIFNNSFSNFKAKLPTNYMRKVLVDSTLSKIPFSAKCIAEAIRNLRSTKGSGTDGLPSVFLKGCGEDMPLLLLNLFTLSLDTGEYPSIWKTSYIIPKYKAGDRASASNYRPINITSVLSRIMEKIIKNGISKYLLAQSQISKSQHGFIGSRSCLTCHLDFFNHITSCRDLRKVVLVLYFDISKAFDKVLHSILYEKSYSIGIRNSLLSWLKSFLTNRFQITKVNSAQSSPKRVTSGVIQGSVLGPLFFTIYINSISSCFNNGKTLLCTDNLKVVYSCDINDLHNTVKIVQQE
ncbi:hypothetical protein MN116_000427 [Schistosoma mekongi]|uniref:Reverse transcriptase domain-containing protein n=1 Tax=Schistosoma mekongi TaxID=38744 RepID=A0AAE1ZDJ3_SCHME|nr:hypothetical protein MN116_000427 [Schistosoma mekongi]